MLCIYVHTRHTYVCTYIAMSVVNQSLWFQAGLFKVSRQVLKQVSFSLQSTLLHCLLGELKPLKGNVDIVGSLGYAAQDPWVFSGTLRENILFGREFDGEWFQQVVDACCLNEDFKQLPYGEATPVGERGVTLSGGQKARVTLARWVHWCESHIGF